ncbi:MAG: apolipoprotein N-acyltransferase [bacterium]|nr:apolipoprotein N-acyltransferase [bacterium]
MKIKGLPEAVAAVGGGVAWGLCFASEPSVWLGWLALAPLMWLVGRPRRVLWGLVHGLVSWLTAGYWLPATLVTYGEVPPVLSWGLLVLLCGFLALFHGLFTALALPLQRRGGAAAWLGLPALWVAIEWLRGFPVGYFGFPWNLAAYAWVAVPGALPLAAWVGSYGVAYPLLVSNVGLALACRRRRWEPAVVGLLAALLPLAVAGRWSRGEEPPAALAREVRIIQPNQSLELSDQAAIWANYRRLIEISEAECRGRPMLLVWPESAAWPFGWERSPQLRHDLGRLAARGCAVVFNTPTAEPSTSGDEVEFFNSALLVTVGGPAARYDKRRLVPWGEFVPLAKILPFVSKLARHAGNFTAGSEVGLLPWDEDRLGMAICYEVIFPEPVAEQVRAGASLLVTISNDAWYGDTAAPRQLFRAARFRAAENRRPLLRAALTGISGVIDRRGAVEAQLGVGAVGVLRARVAGSDELSPYTRAPWLVPLVSALLVAFAMAFAIVDSRRTDHDVTDGSR